MEQIFLTEEFKRENISINKTYKKGETVYGEGTPSFGFYYVSRGNIKVFTHDSNGREVILRIATRGDIFGHSFLFGERTNKNSAKTISESECCFIDGLKFQSIMMNEPRLGHVILRLIGKELDLFQSRCLDLMKKNVRERLASYFCYMARHHGENVPDGRKISLHLTREEIASMIGTASETAIRFISEFKDLGLVREENRHFFIIDQEKLSSLGRSN